MTNRLFSNNEDDSNNQTELSGEDALKLLVGEGAKYGTIEDLAKAAVHSQNHITNLEREATSFKDAQTKQTSIQDILDAVKAGQSNTNQQDDYQTPADQQASGASEVDITKTVQDALAAQTATNSAAANTKLVTDTLSKALGSRVSQVYSKVGQDLGVDLDALSKTSPEAVIRLVTGQGQSAQGQNQLPPSTHTNAYNNSSTSIGGELNYQGIQALYKQGGMTLDKKFRLEQAQAQKLGSSFFK